MDDALTSFEAKGSVLELAGGTGWWTKRLARSADRLTVANSSPEILAPTAETGGDRFKDDREALGIVQRVPPPVAAVYDYGGCSDYREFHRRGKISSLGETN